MRRRKAVILLTAFLAAVAPAAGGCGREKENRFTYKEQLDAEQLAVYRTFEAAVTGGGQEDEEYHSLSAAGGQGEKITVSEHTALCAYQAFLYDHPEYTLLERSFSFRKDRDSQDALIEAVRPEYYTMPGLEENEAQERLAEAAEEMTARIPDGSSERDAAEFLYNTLTQEISYCEEALYVPSLKTEHTAYGALVNKSAVCDGIALAYVYLLDKCDIPCAAVPGQAGGMHHVWVVFYTDGEWLEADPTWGILKRSRYFGLTTAQMSEDHLRDEDGIGLLAPVTDKK